MAQTRNVLLLIFITTIMALVTSALLYVLDQLLTNLLVLSEYSLKLHHLIQPAVRLDRAITAY